MRDQITNDISTCAICQTQKKQSKKYGLLPEKEAEAMPWDRLCVDLIGPKSAGECDHRARTSNVGNFN